MTPKEQQERRRKLEEEDLKFILSTKAGKRFYTKLLDDLGFMADPYNKNNQLQSMAIGRLQLALDYVKRLAFIDIDLYHDMIKEYQRSFIEHIQTRKQEIKQSKS